MDGCAPNQIRFTKPRLTQLQPDTPRAARARNAHAKETNGPIHERAPALPKSPPKNHSHTHTTPTDVFEPRAKLLRALRRRLHVQEPFVQGRGLRHALRRQVLERIGEVGPEVPGAECCYGCQWEYDA